MTSGNDRQLPGSRRVGAPANAGSGAPFAGVGQAAAMDVEGLSTPPFLRLAA